ncbi:hypothetical protein PAXINDRAFT_16117 [Paxillus involutus ATCC 200175]|uniref:Uncharacterized protein n=1 Tax=Paxillus involutus ATCC 200175 TaxID=664439 RepID=A0A0C9TSW8_PAXIN|nr:hypothetical protein PAXINDRAFT_16117 [Paxillus involutus ATCC 200175]
MPLKKIKAPLPPIAWDANDHGLIWQLIVEIMKPQNLKVLCKKLTKHERPIGIQAGDTTSWVPID